MRRKRGPRQIAAPWGSLYWRHWERVDNTAYDLFVCPTPDGLYCELVHRYSGHPLHTWRECLSLSRWMTDAEVFIVAKSKLQELLSKAKTTGLGQAANDVPFATEYPILHELMTSLSADGKAKRQTSSLTVFTQDGMWKACVVEKDNDVSLFGSGETFFGAVANLEARLDAPIVDWRDRAPRGKKK